MTPQETEKRLLYEIGNGEWDSPDLRRLLEEVLTENTRVADYPVDHESDQIGRRTMLLNASQIGRVGDRPDEILLAFEDITDRKRAEESLHALNAELEQRVAERTQEIRLLSEAITHLGEGVLITADDLDWPGPQIVFVNEAMCKTSGYSADELIGQSPHMLQSEESGRQRRWSTFAANWPRDARASPRSPISARMARRTRPKCLSHRCSTPPATARISSRFIGISRLRKRIERELREREERLRAILNTAADAIITIDERGIMQSVNPAAVAMFGYAAEELLGQNVRMLMPAPYRDEHDGYIARFLKTGEARLIGIGRELVGLRKDGTKFPIAVAVSQVDHLGLFTGIVRDITERVALQKQVLEIAAEEDRRIGHELHDNTQQQLTGLGLLASQSGGKSGARIVAARRDGSSAGRWNQGVDQSCPLARSRLGSRRYRCGRTAVGTDQSGRTHRRAIWRAVRISSAPARWKCRTTLSPRIFTASPKRRSTTRSSTARRPESKYHSANRTIRSRWRCLITGSGIADTRARRRSGMGLRIIQYRASLIGATVQIGPGAEGGTLVSCNVFRGGVVCDD